MTYFLLQYTNKDSLKNVPTKDCWVTIDFHYMERKLVQVNGDRWFSVINILDDEKIAIRV